MSGTPAAGDRCVVKDAESAEFGADCIFGEEEGGLFAWMVAWALELLKNVGELRGPRDILEEKRRLRTVFVADVEEEEDVA